MKYWILGFVYCSFASPITVVVSGAMTSARGQEAVAQRGMLVLPDDSRFTTIQVLVSKDYLPVPIKASSLQPSANGTVSLIGAEGAVENQDASQVAEKAFAEAEQLRKQGSAESLRQAIVKYEEALSHWRTAGNRGGEATTLNNIGSVYSSLGEKPKALEYYNQALPIYRAVGDRGGEATTLNNIGLVYSSLGEKPKALEYYNQALPIYRAVGDRGGEATTLNNIGLVYSSLGEKPKALEYYNQALPLRRAVGDRGGEATTLNNIGSVYSSLGEKPKALEYYNQALPIYRAVGDRGGEATTLTNIGLVYSSLGEKPKALEYYNQALPLRRAVGDRGGEATTLTNIGSVYSSLGEKPKALEYYNQALPLRRAVGDRGGEATTLNNIGLVYSSLGEKPKALEYYNQALPIYRAVGDRGGEATTLTNIGSVYSSLGEKPKALEYYNQALPLRRAVGDRGGEATTLNNIGSVYSSLGEKPKALEYYNQALPLRRAVGDRGGEATTLNNIGLVYSSLGEKPKALEYYNQALPIYRAVGDRGGEATTLNNIGSVYSSLGEKPKALEYYNQALPIYRAVGDRGGEAIVLVSMAYTQRDLGNYNQARTQVEAALEIVELLRVKVTNQDLRTSYFATVQDYYEFYIDLLMQMHQQSPSAGYDTLALQVSERARARSLLEILAEAKAEIRQGIDPTLLERERSLQQQLSAKEESRVKLVSGKYTEQELAAVKKEIDTLLDQYQDIQTEIRQKSPRYAALTQPQPLTLLQIQQQVLDENTLLLQYSLGKERSYLWVVSKTGMTSYELPARAEIEKAARQFYDFLTVPSERIRTAKAAAVGMALSQMLLAPVAQQLGQKRLLIVGDGVLNYIPFSALPIPQPAKDANRTDTETVAQPLIVAHEIISLPSASTLALLRQDLAKRTPAPKTLAILADPVFNDKDERLKNSLASVGTQTQQTSSAPINLNGTPTDIIDLQRDASLLSRLPGTGAEAKEILALVPASERLSKLGFAANRQVVESGVLEQYRIVHFATHGLLNDEHPELSGIWLSTVSEQGQSQPGFLSTSDIFNLKLPADLVVLSACRTGLGKEIKGEGLSGLTRGFMYAGAARVVASLWSVGDEATSKLMTRFYQGMIEQKLSPSAALRAAQLSMWKENPQWDSFYNWAAFTVQGDWN